MFSRLLRQLGSLRHIKPAAQGGHAITDSASSPWILEPEAEGSYAGISGSDQGLFIFNAFDQGVGWQLRTYGAYDAPQMALLMRLAGDAQVVLDVGANIGITTVILGRAVGASGRVHAFEPQRSIFHMLAGNIALNGLDNIECHCMAVGAAPGEATLPRLDYRSHASFGSVELNRAHQSDARQQAIGGQFDRVPMTSIDALDIPRLDLIKIDVEGMEEDVLTGARATLARHQPLMYVEHLKSDKQSLARRLVDAGYLLFDAYENFVCIPESRADIETLVAGLEPFPMTK